MAFSVTRRWEQRFPAMGTHCHIIIEGGARDLLPFAQQRVAELQALWTRFDDSSELSRLSRSGGGEVAPETFGLITRGLVGWRITAGRFDPFMADQIVAAGYDRDFDELTPPPDGGGQVDSAARPLSGRPRRPVIHLDRRRHRVGLAPGVSVDSGGLGKGLAADLISEEVCSKGADACLVNLGGDLRVRGSRRDPWRIAVSDESGMDAEPISINLRGGGLATSSVTRRRWLTSDGTVAHHLLDPRTGRSLTARWAAVTAIAPQAWLAEVLSKSAFGLPLRATRRLLTSRQAALVTQGWEGAITQLP